MAEENDLPNPNTTSSDYDEMAPFWEMVNAILGGVENLRMPFYTSVPGPHRPYNLLAQLNRGTTHSRSLYLPKFPNETATDYELRRCNAPLTNIYSDISSSLASKPFSKTLELEEGSPEDLKKLSENIDGQGNNLHVFARKVFKNGLDKGIDWILVDYTKVPAGTTLADERAMGARPYWVHIPAERMLAVYSRFVSGQEIITHARIHEPCVEVEGYAEVVYDRVRVLNRAPILAANSTIIGYGPATWELYQEITNENSKDKKTEWQLIDAGNISIGIIPLVPFVAGERDGTRWKVRAPLAHIAHLQIEEFQQESNLKTIKEMTAFPMVTGNGVTLDKDETGTSTVVPIGPKAVLVAPMGSDGRHGEWRFIEPSATSLTFLANDLEKLRTEMRDLGMQPLTAPTLTVITTANVAMRAHSAVQAWAIALKDALEQTWKYTVMWLGQKIEVTVNVHTDFGVDLTADKDLDYLLRSEAQGVLSSETVRSEMKRRGVLSDDFEEDEETQRLAEQEKGLVPEQAIDPVTGAIVQPSTRPRLVPAKTQMPPGTVN